MSVKAPYSGYMTCPCCKLPKPKAVDPTTEVTAQVCAQCTHHQGDQDAKRVKRAESHEEMLRERLDACRKSEAKARAEVKAALDEATQARSATVAALQSRGRLARRIVDADGHGEFQALAHDSQVMDWARRADRDDEPPFLEIFG